MTITSGYSLQGNISNQTYKLGSFVAKGGEGSIYNIEGYPNYVAKIYHNSPNGTLCRKLTYMTVCQKPLLSEYMAWPIEVLSVNDNIEGYMMSKITDCKPLELMVCDTQKFSYNDRLKLAYNISAITYNMHAVGHIIGDYNTKNILVNPTTGMTYLVDCDSFHITDTKSNYTYRCMVGIGHYIPPELAKKLHATNTNLITIQGENFTKQTDLFALAIHIFSYLVNGRHPFDMAKMSSSKSSVSVPERINAIENGYYIYSKIIRTGLMSHLKYLTIPPDAKKAYENLPKGIKDYFEKVFVDGYNNPFMRPTAKEWCNLLKEYIK